MSISLPPSYREFLKATNGWRDEYPGTPILRPVEKINWFYTENKDLVDEWIYIEKHSSYSSTTPDEEYFVCDRWTYGFRTKYMQTALQISDDDDGDVVLLNPKIINNNEWETWILRGSCGDGKRYHSFQEMIQTLGMVEWWVL